MGTQLYTVVVFLFLAVPCNLWFLGSLTRDQTRGHHSERAES